MAVCLKIIHGIGQGQTLAVPNDTPVTLGRSSQASYAFDDPLLSRKHCAVECRGNAQRVVDLQSRNGTFVNGARIAAPQLLKMGDRIKIGSILFEVAPAVQGTPNLVMPGTVVTGGTPAPPLPPPAMSGPVDFGATVAATPDMIASSVGAYAAAHAAPPAYGAPPPPPPSYAAPPPPPPAYGAPPPPPSYGAPPAPQSFPPAPQGYPSAFPYGAQPSYGAPPAPQQFPGMGAPPAAAPVVQSSGFCEACRRPIQPHEARPFKGRVVCPRCLDRFDVDEDLIEGFKILERLHATGTGTVYKAKQLLMGRMVTLKTLVTSGGADEKSLRRFMREAKAGGRLSHPSIVELYDVNEQGDLMYIVMEYIEGDSLEAMLKARGPLPVAEVLRYMLQVGDAIRYAHEQQIIHRDIRPATIVVRKEDNRAKLTDFTLAKNLERAAFSVITADGEAIGTPYYMPPEQVKSAKAADTRSDIYSFAATIYHVLAGRHPIEARSYGDFISKVFAQEATPLKDVVPSAPPKLSALLGKCLAKDQAQRPQDMDAVLAEVTQIHKALAGSVA